ncbi:MAG: fibronectin type III domain-containing protein [Bacteroidota bacterium]
MASLFNFQLSTFRSSYLPVFLALSLVASFSNALVGQEDYPLRLIADPRDGEIRLRWAPLDEASWELGNRQGYRLERVTNSSGVRETLATSLRPLSVNEWGVLLDTIPAATMYYGALYSEDLQVTSDTPQELAEVIRANRYGLSLLTADQYFAVSLAAGLGFQDTNVDADESYDYYLSINGLASANGAELPFLRVFASQRSPLPSPATPVAKWDNLKVTLSWDQSQTNRFYTTYSVEAAENGGPFIRRNDFPLLYIDTDDSDDQNLYFTDSLRSNEVEYTYRIVGRTPFGVDGNPSKTVTGTGVPLPLGYTPRITKIQQTTDDGIQLQWFVQREAAGLYTGFHIYRSIDGQTNWEQITPRPLPVERRTYTDRDARSGWLYQVRLIDLNGYEVGGTPRLLVLEDNDPPAPPTGLSGTMDENGIVNLNWSPNSERDHRAYRVFWSNQLNGSYVQVTTDAILDTNFLDTLTMNTLTEQAFYKLKAEDYYGNYSDFSEAGIIERPDLIPPGPPVINLVENDAQGVTVGWTESPSEDVVQYTLERRLYAGIDTKWVAVYKTDGEQNQYVDQSVQLGGRYEYRVKVTDDADLFSYSKPGVGTRIDDGQRATITELEAVANSDRVIITFSCLYPVDPEYFQLYRSINGGGLTTYKTMKLDQPLLTRTGKQTFRFVDRQVKTDDSIEYRILARYADGGFTPLSESVSVRIE